MSYRINKNPNTSSNKSFGRKNSRSNNFDSRQKSRSNRMKENQNSSNNPNQRDFIDNINNKNVSNKYRPKNNHRNKLDTKPTIQRNTNDRLKANEYSERKQKNNSLMFDSPYRNSQEIIQNNYNPSLHREDRSGSSPSESFSNSQPVDLLWGRHTTEAALLSGRPLHRIWCTQELRSSSKFFQLLKDAKSVGVLVEEVSWSRLGQITKGAVHQGIVLQTAASKTLELKQLVDACKPFGDSALLLALDGLTDPQNLGSIVRSAEALGAHGLVLPQRRSAGLTGSVAKVAAGALEHMPVARVVNLNRYLEQLKNSGYRVIGLAEEGDMTLPEVDLDGSLVVVTGSEDKGISLITRRICDQLVRIPLRGVTTSLNASVATSIFLYEVARRRWMRSLSGQAPSPRLSKPQLSSFLSMSNSIDLEVNKKES